jgi:hypothetical protein
MKAFGLRPSSRPPRESKGGFETNALDLRVALGLIALMMGAHLLFLMMGCDWDLCGDEAEYWAWSRRLDWSYYAKGPLIAYVIRLGTELFGGASLALTGSLMPAVRFPAVVLGGLTAWGIYRLAEETCQGSRAGLIAVLILPAVPLFRLGGLLMTIDVPLICCWAWAAVWSYRAIRRDDARGWLIAGVLAALGVMAKYTMLAFPASVGLFLLVARADRRQLVRPGFWLMAVGCLIGMAPILYWNARHHWVAADQMSSRLGLVGAPGQGAVRTLVGFLAGEVAVLGFWAIAGLFAFGQALREALRRRDGSQPAPTETDTPRDDPSGRTYLLCLWIPVWSACIAACLMGESEANWSAPAHVSLIALIGGWFASRSSLGSHRKARRALAWSFTAAWVLSVIGLGALQHTEWFYPLIAGRLPAPTLERPMPLRKWDPTCRMRGFRELAPRVDAVVAALRAGGQDPFVLAPTYTLAATLSFYMKGQPEVYCLAWSPGLMEQAVNQHDLWYPNPRHDVDAFRGRPVVLVEDAGEMWRYSWQIAKLGVVERVDPAANVVVDRRGAVVATWAISLCHDYHGPQHVEEYRQLVRKYATADYYAAQGGTSRGFVQGLFRDIIGRKPTPRELALWTGVSDEQPRGYVVPALTAKFKYEKKKR